MMRASFLLAALLFACGPGDPVALPHFASLPIVYTIDANVPEAVRLEIHRGIKLWDDRTVEHISEFAGIEAWHHDFPDQWTSPGHSAVYVTEQPYTYYDYEAQEVVPTDYIAVAVPHTEGDRPRILECDIFLFEFSRNFVTGREEEPYHGRTVDIATTVGHEFGHCLGLGHSEDPNDLMFPTNHLRLEALGWDWIPSMGEGDLYEFSLRYDDLTYMGDA